MDGPPEGGSPPVWTARLAAAACLLLAGVGAVAFAVHHDLTTPFRGWAEREVFVEVPPGAAAPVIVRSLEEAGVVPSARILRLYLRWTGRGGALRAGEYRFTEAASPLDVLSRIEAGDVFLHRLTVPEGLDLAQTKALLADRGPWSPEELAAAVARPELVEDLAPSAASLEGYLFPETYAYPRTATAEDLVDAMVARFREVFSRELRAEAEALGLTVHEAVTVASLIEDEVRVPTEAPLVSSVIHNRLERGMRLQIDATVIYALKRDGRWKPPLLKRELDHDSPWNTYRVAGIPPGPICNPGRTALEAAVRPAETELFYYVLRPDGSGAHDFSRTSREHEAAVRRLRRGSS